MIDGYWLATHRADPRVIALYRRHYSVKNHRANWFCGVTGPGESMVLLTQDCDALFVWRKRIAEALMANGYTDGQGGIGCSVFRNESPILSSDLIREACALAWQRWPDERLFTYVEDGKVRSSNPGYCFQVAGWRKCGRNKDGRLTILEILPSWVQSEAA